MIRPASDDDFASLIAGSAPAGLCLPGGPVESPEILAMLRELARSIAAHFAPAAWLIVDGNEIAGLCSLVRMPADRACYIGYGIAPGKRGRGLATSAVADLVAWALADDRVDRMCAETSVANPASQRVLLRNGFAENGRRTDREDGPLVCWERTVTR